MLIGMLLVNERMLGESCYLMNESSQISFFNFFVPTVSLKLLVVSLPKLQNDNFFFFFSTSNF